MCLSGREGKNYHEFALYTPLCFCKNGFHHVDGMVKAVASLFISAGVDKKMIKRNISKFIATQPLKTPSSSFPLSTETFPLTDKC